MELDIKKPALPAGEDFGNSTHRLRQKLATLNDPQTAGALCYEKTPVGEFDHAPGVLKPFGNDFDLEVLLLRGDDFPIGP
jgi:hypothetical protein